MEYEDEETQNTLQGDENQLNDEQASFLKSLQSDEDEQDAEITIQDKAQEEAQVRKKCKRLKPCCRLRLKGWAF